MAVSETAPAAAPKPTMAAITPTKVALTPKKETAPARGGPEHFTVQLGSYQVEETAHKLAERVAAAGLAVTVTHSNDRDGRTWFVVRSGDFASADEAASMLASAKALSGQPAIVVHTHPTAPAPTQSAPAA